MGDEQFNDFKQFVAETVSQSEARLKQKLVSKEDLAAGLKAVRHEVRDGFSGVGDAIDNLGDHIDERFDKVEARLDDHEQRITRLEADAA